jgi:hypothetical protein
MTAEKVLCDLSGLECPGLSHRASPELEYKLKDACQAVVRELPPLKTWVGSQAGTRGGQSKSVVDFITSDGKTVSVKTNIRSSDKVCPPEVGQPGQATMEKYFGHLSRPPIDGEAFKRMCFERFPEMLAIYVKHLLDCDYLVWIGGDRGGSFAATVYPRQDIDSIDWSQFRFTFSRSPKTWNESSTVRVWVDSQQYSLGEFQVHKHRSCYKFRLNLRTLMRLIQKT